ncbi:MAG: hypothetical protein MUQ10_03770 [Anaerolineae bacterium]|nr:hypothetical protein [Anaerolineae bacterium]
MFVSVLFDVEDLVDPGSDDVPRDIAQILAADGLIASMCVVGEKARLWERRGRHDVIQAVGQHDVSLHTNRHSIHPTVSEYLADRGWIDGVAEAMEREDTGARDLVRILGKYPSSWGTSGSSWAPQIPAATRRLGIPSHVYSLAETGTTGACWFAGQLCYYDQIFIPGGEDALCDDAQFEISLSALLQKVQKAQQLGRECIGLFAGHPTRYRYTVFWDALNYADGENTDPHSYRFAPRRSAETYVIGLRNLRRMLLAVREMPGIDIAPLRAVNGRFALEASPIFAEGVQNLALEVADSATIATDNPTSSPAQSLDILARMFLHVRETGSTPAAMLQRTVLGPTEEPSRLDTPMELSIEHLENIARSLVQHIDTTGHLPASLDSDATPIGPGPLLGGLARTVAAFSQGKQIESTTMPPGFDEPAAAVQLSRYIHERLPGWPPHRRDLQLDGLALHTRLQSWSMKPAALSK